MQNDTNENNDRKQERRQKINKNKKKTPGFYDEDSTPSNKLKKEYKKNKEIFDEEEWETWNKYYNR